MNFRFTIAAKIYASFAVIIIFILFSVMFLFNQIDDAFSAGKADIQNYSIGLQIGQHIGKIFSEEIVDARSYISTLDPSGYDRFYEHTGDFENAVDSLQRSVPRSDTKNILTALLATHSKYHDFVTLYHQNANKGKTVEILQNESNLADSTLIALHNLNTAFLLLIRKEVNLSETRRQVAMDGVIYTLGLSLIVAVGIMFFMGRAVTKPIQSLKSGTEKVSEAHYETVAVTSNDEIADLTIAFNLMSEKLRQLDEMRMQLMSEISHEMRTPLQVIKAGCHAILHAKDGPKLTQRQVDAVGMIHGATNRINSFVNSFLDIAKMEAGLMKFNMESVDINEFVTPLINEAQLIGQARQVKVEFQTHPIHPILIDKERMQQVISNLISNALKYTPDSGTITVRIAKIDAYPGITNNSRGCVKIDVQDTGVGIPKDDLEKLFNKFYQAKNTPVIKVKGSGLGLALVKHVTEAHGGKVAVASEENVGSTFSVILPA